MGNRKPYDGKWTALSAWTLKAVGLVIASAAIVMVALAITKGISRDPGSPGGGRFVGVRHEAITIPSTADPLSGVPAPGAGPDQELPGDTVVRNGLTIVSPPLLVPVIDMNALRTVNVAEEGTSFRRGNARKRSRYARRSHNRRQKNADNRWPAFGVAIR